MLPGVPMDMFEWRGIESVRLRSGERWKFINRLVQTPRDLDDAFKLLSQHNDLAYDTETSGLKPHLGARICGHTTSVPTGTRELTNFYIPVRHQATHETQLPPGVVAGFFRSLFIPSRRVRGHHLKFDAAMSRYDDMPIESEWFDTAVMANVFDENEPSFGLKRLSDKYLFPGAAEEEKSLTEWLRKDAHRLKLAYHDRKKDRPDEPTYLERYGYARSPIQLCGLYACHDTAMTWLLSEFYGPGIFPQYQQVYEREIAIAHELYELECWGLPVNVDEIHKADQLVQEEVKHWQAVVTKLAGGPVETTDNGLRRLFFDQLKMSPSKLTKNEQASVDKESRKLLQKKYPTHAKLIKAVDRLAVAEKVRSTYTHSWLRYVTPQHRVHSSYNQLEQRDEEGIPKTGRLSSVEPNAQNVSGKPVHLHTCGCDDCAKEDGNPPGPEQSISIRRYYTVPKGWARFFIDLSQIELRVLAWFSRDPRLLYCYANDLDVHTITANEVTGGNRKVAKEVNFGNNYGMTAIGLSKRLPYYAEDPDRALADAEMYLHKFFEVYAGIPIFRDNFANQMRRNGNMFVNPFGRPRRIPTISSSDRKERARAERMMMSSIISGTSADLLKEIIRRCRTVLNQAYGHLAYEERGRFVQTIHDENIFDLPIAGCGQTIHQLARCFTDWPMFEKAGVPIRCNVEVSTTTWEDKKAIKLLPDGNFQWAA